MDQNTSKLTPYAYISGVSGLLFIQLCGFLFEKYKIKEHGVALFHWKITSGYEASVFLMLVLTGLLMFFIELLIRVKIEKKSFLSLHPAWEQKNKPKKWILFFSGVFIYYISYMAVLFLFLFLYEHTLEYTEAEYKPWFVLLEGSIFVLLYFLPVYIILTRAFQYSELLDKKEPVFLFWKFFIFLMLRARLLWVLPAPIKKKVITYFNFADHPQGRDWDQKDGQILLGIFVKAFYIPLMSIFFIDQFGSLHGNWGYLLENFDPFKKDYNFSSFTLDYYNIIFTFIFVTDVGLAWCGYVFSSRWSKNYIKSTEPTFLGWAVALLCYPPFNSFLHTYFSIPSDKNFLDFNHPYFTFFLATLSLLSYGLYMSATVCFGLRFSNLTNRGIIQTGAYKYIRHPAYTGKNISWWCVILPFIIYQSIEASSYMPLVNVLGLILMTILYYYRAVTEEKHLLQDPEYQEYCKKVPYRFIPGWK